MSRKAMYIHQTWEMRDTLTPEMKESIEEWKRLHPGMEHRFWDRTDRATFMRTHYPKYYPTYESYEHGVMKADMFRIAALHFYGGIYSDTDIAPVTDLRETDLWQKPLVFAPYDASMDMTNSLIISRTPGHPLLVRVLDHMLELRKKWLPWKPFVTRHRYVVMQTGPGAIRSALGKHPDVYYIPESEFSPCTTCDEFTESCPKHAGRYVRHFKGRTWNSNVRMNAVAFLCKCKRHWILTTLVVLALWHAFLWRVFARYRLFCARK